MCHLVYKKGEKREKDYFVKKFVGWIKGSRRGIKRGFCVTFSYREMLKLKAIVNLELKIEDKDGWKNWSMGEGDFENLLCCLSLFLTLKSNDDVVVDFAKY